LIIWVDKQTGMQRVVGLAVFFLPFVGLIVILPLVVSLKIALGAIALEGAYIWAVVFVMNARGTPISLAYWWHRKTQNRGGWHRTSYTILYMSAGIYFWWVLLLLYPLKRQWARLP